MLPDIDDDKLFGDRMEIRMSYGRTYGARDNCASKNQIPALMAEGSIPPYTALEQSTLVPAFCGKIFLLQTIAVLRTGGRVQ